MNITVVIPFYQKRPGILIKAVNSALVQKGTHTLKILIVDDASPVPARDELRAICDAHPGLIRIIEQANAGPAAARNRALDEVAPNTDLVAFLDSDDEWVADHLSNACLALGDRNDFYFADHFQLNQKISAFKRAGRIQPEKHMPIVDCAGLYEYSGDMFDQILMGNVIGTSTVVYSYRKFPLLRFREAFVHAGEDYLFWLELSKLSSRFCFSSACECTYGEGVNIFAGSGWGTEKSLARIHYELKYKKAIQQLFVLTAVQKASNQQAISGLRSSFVADVLHRLAHKKSIERSLLRQHWSVDVYTFLLFIPLALKLKLRLGHKQT